MVKERNRNVLLRNIGVWDRLYNDRVGNLQWSENEEADQKQIQQRRKDKYRKGQLSNEALWNTSFRGL